MQIQVNGRRQSIRRFKVMAPLATQGGSHIRFRGQWLALAGFPVGAYFTVTNPSPGVLDLRVNGASPITPGFTQTVAALALPVGTL